MNGKNKRQIGLWLETSTGKWIVSLDEVYEDGSNASSTTLHVCETHSEAEHKAQSESCTRGLPVVEN